MEGAMRAILALLAMTGVAAASDETPVKAAMKKIGPAYMCGANFEYVEALQTLRAELVKVGLAEFAADAAIDGVRKAAEANETDRLKLTARDCAEKYGRLN